MSNTFLYTVNARIKDKAQRDQMWLLTKHFKNKKGSLEDLKTDIKKGYALCATQLDGLSRCDAHFKRSQILFVDIDNGWTIDEAVVSSLVQSHFRLIYTTPSHTEENHRFRIAGILPVVIEDCLVYKKLVEIVLEKFKAADTSCKDGARVFYGSTTAIFPFENTDNFIPIEWIDEAYERAEVERQLEQKRQVEAEKRREEFESLSQEEKDDLYSEIEKALMYIPGRRPGTGTYKDTLRVLRALVNHYGEHQAIQIAERWNPSTSDFNVAQKIKSFRGKADKVSIGSIFYHAIQNGYTFPKKIKKQIAKVSTPAIITRDQKIKAECDRLSALTYKATQKFNQKYLPEIRLTSPLILISSPTGSGKTERMKSFKTQALARNPEAKVINISYRNALSKQTGKRVGLMHVHDIGDDIAKQQFYTSCVDSILKVKLDSITYGSLLIFDEVEAILDHVLNGSTVRRRRLAILSHLKEVIRTVIERGGNVIAMEADLTDVSVAHLLWLVDNAEYSLYINEYEAIRFPITIIEGEDRRLSFQVLVEGVSVGKRQMFVSNSQKACEQAAKQIEKKFPGKFVFRIDGKTSDDPEVKRALEDLNNATDKNHIYVLVISPSLESGGNITTKAYEQVVFYFTGISIRKANQMLCRLRTGVPRIGVLKNNTFLNGETNSALFVEDIRKNLMDNASDAERLCEKLGHESFQKLAFDLAKDGDGNVLQNMMRLEQGDLSYDKMQYLQTAIELQARDNCSSVRLKDAFVEYYSSKGFEINQITLELSEETKGATKAASKEIKQEELEAHINADHTLSEDETKSIMDSTCATSAERLAAKVSMAYQETGCELDFKNPEIVEEIFIKNDGKQLGKIKAMAQFLNPRQSEMKFKKEMTNADQKLLTDVNLLYPKLHYLREELKFDQLLQLKETFNNDHPVVQEIHRLANQDRKKFQRVLGLGIDDKTSPMDICGKIMRYIFGFSFASKKAGKKGKQKTVYWLDVDKNPAYAQVYYAVQKKLMSERDITDKTVYRVQKHQTVVNADVSTVKQLAISV